MKEFVLFIRRPIVVFIQIGLIIISYFAAFATRFDPDFVFTKPHLFLAFTSTLPALILIRIVSYWYFDLFKGLWKYVSIKDIRDIVIASLAGTIIFAFYAFVVMRIPGFPRSVLIIDCAYNILLFSGIRMLVRVYRESRSQQREGDERRKKNVLIVGAGDAGEMIVREMMKNPRLGYHPVGFVDDDRDKRKKTIHRYPVLGNTRTIPRLITELGVSEVFIAIPSATGKSIRRIVNICKSADVRFKTLPFVSDLIDGNVSISQVRDVNIEDLLGRETVNLDMELIGHDLSNKVILISGAAGSIGSELVRQVANFQPKKIILFEKGENDLYHLDLELKEGSWHTTFIPYIGDVRDRGSLASCMKRYRPSYVFHAAAYKHVPLMEINPAQAIKNNVLGTRNAVDVAAEYEVEKFVLISTDKAVRPTNIMGASKRLAELILQAKATGQNCRTQYVAVRFGNVLGSNGSVIPLFKKQIASGGPVTVTHSEVIRYFMTIPEAVQLVIQAGVMGKGGEISLLEMGDPVKIKTLAENLIRLSGLVPDKDIKIVYTGLRPGEKLYEELITEGEGIKETRHKKIKVLQCNQLDADVFYRNIEYLELACQKGDISEMKLIVKELVPEYTPKNGADILPVKCDDYVNVELPVTVH